jgi:hypothetical protein
MRSSVHGAFQWVRFAKLEFMRGARPPISSMNTMLALSRACLLDSSTRASRVNYARSTRLAFSTIWAPRLRCLCSNERARRAKRHRTTYNRTGPSAPSRSSCRRCNSRCQTAGPYGPLPLRGPGYLRPSPTFNHRSLRPVNPDSIFRFNHRASPIHRTLGNDCGLLERCFRVSYRNLVG